MKNITIIGATGFVGRSLVVEFLSRGYFVTALSRDISKLEIDNDAINGISVDVNDTTALTEALKGSKTVVSAFNPGWENPNIYEDFLEGSKNIQKAVKAAGVGRYIVIGGAGSLQGQDGKQLVDGADFPASIKPGATAARDYLNVLRDETEFDWTFFSPAIEMHQGITTGRTGSYRLGKDQPVFDENGRSILSVQDLAVVIADETESGKHLKQRFTAAY